MNLSFSSMVTAMMLIMMQRDKDHTELASNNEFEEEYDFVIVGAGSAGCVVANRLSENPQWNVLLFEAGGQENLESEIPERIGHLGMSELDWNYTSVSQKLAVQGFYGERVNIPRGHVLGGSSTINAMQYMRGVPEDYNSWERDFNATGWSWEGVKEYFLKSEGQTDPLVAADTVHHSTKGELKVSTFPSPNIILKTFVDAAVEKGFKRIDFNAEATGVGHAQQTIYEGYRMSTARAFLKPIFKERKNLQILTRAFVTRVNFDKNTAVGVQFERDGKMEHVRVTKEVILSAGSINTPKILMLSGIGPKDHLNEHGIAVLADLPVGNNLKDHNYVYNQHYTINETVPQGDELMTVNNLSEFYINGTGTLTDVTQATLRTSTKFAIKKDGSWPDVQIYAFQGTFADYKDEYEAAKHGLKEDIYNQVFKPYQGKSGMYTLVYLPRPASSGTIRLSSTRPKDPPIIDPNYLSDQSDIDTLVDGMRIAYEVMNAKAIKERLHAEGYKSLYPGCDKLYKREVKGSDIFDSKSDVIPNSKYLACVSKLMTASYKHHACTCRMGGENDPLAVVTPQLKVRNVNKLRIIDSSVPPQLVSGHMNAPTIMIGEKGSDMIKQEYKHQ